MASNPGVHGTDGYVKILERGTSIWERVLLVFAVEVYPCAFET
jgi:hypothetical protein